MSHSKYCLSRTSMAACRHAVIVLKHRFILWWLSQFLQCFVLCSSLLNNIIAIVLLCCFRASHGRGMCPPPASPPPPPPLPFLNSWIRPCISNQIDHIECIYIVRNVIKTLLKESVCSFSSVFDHILDNIDTFNVINLVTDAGLDPGI